MPPESDSDILTAESVALQVIEGNQELAKQYASGDLAVFSALQEKAVELAAGRLNEQTVRDTLMRKLGASI